MARRVENSSLSWRSGVLITGQSSSSFRPMKSTAPPRNGSISKAAVEPSRRMVTLATSASGEMITSIGMWSRWNRSLHSGAR